MERPEINTNEYFLLKNYLNKKEEFFVNSFCKRE